MLGELFEQYLKKGLDRQLVNRVPYAFYLSLLIFLILQYRDPGYAFGNVSYAVLGLTLLTFVATSYYFGKTTSRRLSDGMFKQDFRPFVAKFREIYEGNDSVVSDLDKIENWRMILVGAICGISISGFLSTAFLFVLVFLHPSLDVLLFAILLTTLYIFYEIVKAPLLEQGDGERRESAPMDAFENYTITNSVKSLPFKSRSLLFIASKFLGPIVHIEIPQFSVEAPLVYENPELSREMIRLASCEGGQKVCFKDEEGLKLKEFFEGNWDIRTESITVVSYKSPKEVLPYIFDSKYEYTQREERVWSGFTILDTTQNRAIARGFVHKFRAVAARSRVSKGGEKLTPHYVNTKALQFFLVGDRSYVQYFKTKIESLSVKVPSEVFSIEDNSRPRRS